MASNLLEKAYNCYIRFLNNLTYGRTNQNYSLLYDAILSLKENITDKQFVQYFENNLTCPKLYTINITDEMARIFAWDLSSSDTSSSFTWHEFGTPTLGDYNFTTNTKYGLNFLYIAVPSGVNFIIYDQLGSRLHDSSLPENAMGQHFEMVGTSKMSSGAINVVWKKTNPFSTTTYPVEFKVKLS